MLENSLDDISKKEETIAKATHVVESLKREVAFSSFFPILDQDC